MDPYKTISKEYEKFLKHKDTKREVNFLSRILKKGSVLDAGCGKGRHAVPLALKGFKVVAVDISESMLNAAKRYAREKHVNVEFIKGDISTISLRSSFFDNIISMYSVLSELNEKNRLITLKNFSKWIKPKGRVVVEVPNLEAFLNLGMEKLKQGGFYRLNSPGDFVFKINKRCSLNVHLFSFYEIKYLFEIFGFKLAKVWGENFKRFNPETSKNMILLFRMI